MSEKKPSRLALGVALLLMGLILVSNSQKTYISTNDSFANEPVSIKGFTQENIQSVAIAKKILIPDLGIDLEVKEADVKGGYWEVFEDKAGWGKGSGLPGQVGNQVIFAHARESLFLPLRSVKLGVKIYLLTDLGWYDYQVTDIKEVNPREIEVISPTDDETLTLYTCSGYQDSKRLIVTAKPI